MQINVGTESEQMFVSFESKKDQRKFAPDQTGADKLIRFASGQFLLPTLPLVKFYFLAWVPLNIQAQDLMAQFAFIIISYIKLSLVSNLTNFIFNFILVC